MGSSGAPIFDGTKGDRRYKPDLRKRARIIQGGAGAASEDADGSRKQEFRQILEEVQKLRTSQLSWKERKELESKKLVALGGKPAKSFKMPISMGLAIKRKREKLEAEKMEQDLLAGFLPAKRKKKTLRESNDDKGLRLSEGKFKGGVLYVQKPEAKAAGDGKRGGRDRLLDKVFDEGGSKKGGKSKKGKGKRGGKKGGKRKR